MRSPIVWFGGKGNFVKKLLDLMPPHHTYVEVFGGGASLLFAKEPAAVEVYNDIDRGLVDFFRVLRDEDLFLRFKALVELTPYSRAEYNDCRRTWEDSDDVVERARRWFVVARQSFSGRFGRGWSFSRGASCRGIAMAPAKWLTAIEFLGEAHSRMMIVQIESSDWRNILCTYDTDETFFYLDPPYIQQTRRSGRYAHELAGEDHCDLVEVIQGVRGMVMLSGYNHPIYAPLNNGAGWTRYDYETACHAVGRTRGTGILVEGAALSMQPRTESVWLNRAAQEARLAAIQLPLFE